MQRSVLRMLHCGDSCKFPCKSIFIASGRLGKRRGKQRFSRWIGRGRIAGAGNVMKIALPAFVLLIEYENK